MRVQLLAIIVVCAYFIVPNKGLTIKEVSAEDDTEGTTTISRVENGYRKSVAKIKETSYRVPEHLQFVPKGFIYEEADDVIHVIDPPKHFEELKKIMQRQEQRRLQNLRPIALRERRPRPKIIKTMLPVRPKSEAVPRKPLPEPDMQTQEAQDLPFEILASVRKTENYLRKYKPKLPSVKQRLKTHKIQTVIWEQQTEQQQFQQGQEEKIQGVREQTANRRRFNKIRLKRETATREHQSLKGEELLKHLSALINNASSYLKQAESFEDYTDSDLESTTSKKEILPQFTTAPTHFSSSALNDDMVVKILENSVKATNMIMQQLKTQANLTAIGDKCDHLKVTYPNHVQHLQNQIKCMQSFIEDVNHRQQWEPPLKAKPLYEQTNGKRLTHQPFWVAQLGADNNQDPTPTPLNSSLIYDDVMTTIRNMLHLQNVQSIEDATDRTVSTWGDVFAHDKSPEPVDLVNLQEYLNSLQAIVAHLPKFSHKSLYLHEFEAGSPSKYYFINPVGNIYSLPHPFQKDTVTTPPTAIFREFPDLPLVTEYLRKGTLLPPSAKVVEIL